MSNKKSKRSPIVEFEPPLKLRETFVEEIVGVYKPDPAEARRGLLEANAERKAAVADPVEVQAKLQQVLDYLAKEKAEWLKDKLLEACEGKDLICPHCEKLIEKAKPNMNAIILLWEQLFGKAKQKVELEARAVPASAAEMSIWLRDAKAAERSEGSAAIRDFDRYSVQPSLPPPRVIVDVTADDADGAMV